MAERDAVRKLEAGLRGEADHVSFVPHCILELLDLREYAEDEQGREQLIARQLATVGRGLQNDPEAQRRQRPDGSAGAPPVKDQATDTTDWA
ncbi:hypothetical protein FJT64_019634 [Amphibalanus amphitrite]|uniref:Uncharacterized protein n=1 Tax=Amphibalanus amphitrite TaxID=1232801 RepID=A0A6A4WZE5_AMPAM|nr:hypothetical protein FJT64_019634 [Amphibalanus amphitrite]